MPERALCSHRGAIIFHARFLDSGKGAKTEHCSFGRLSRPGLSEKTLFGIYISAALPSFGRNRALKHNRTRSCAISALFTVCKEAYIRLAVDGGLLIDVLLLLLL